MYPTRVVDRTAAVLRTPPRPGATAPLALPQPGLRLMGMASLGIGTGLFSASVPSEVLVLAFAPALVTLVMLAIRSTFAGPDRARSESEEVRHG